MNRDTSSGEASSPGLISSDESSDIGLIGRPFVEDLDGRGYDHRWLSGQFPGAQEIYGLHTAAQRVLQFSGANLDLPERKAVEEVKMPSVQAGYGPFSSSAWLRRHPILGPVLGGGESSEVEITPRASALGASRSASRSARSPSAKASLEEFKDNESGGLRAVDEEILKLLNEVLKGQQEARERDAVVSLAADAASVQRAAEAAEKAAQMAKGAMKATRKQHLSVSTFMALGVQDHRLLLLDCFLAWGQLRRKPAGLREPAAQVKEAMAQVCSDDERPNMQLEIWEARPRRHPAGNGSVPPVLPGHTLRALLGEEVVLEDNGSIRGASLLLSMRPPRASRQFLQSFDICLPWAEVQQDFGPKPSQEVSIQTSPRGDEMPKAGDSPKQEADDLTPEQVLRRISGLQAEMTEMETSLDQLRHEFEVEAVEADHVEDLEGPLVDSKAVEKVMPMPSKPRRMSRLRQRLPESLAWLEEAARSGRARAGRRLSRG